MLSLAEEGLLKAATADRFLLQSCLHALGQGLCSVCPLCKSVGELEEAGATEVLCSSCERAYCHSCGTAWHDGRTCEAACEEIAEAARRHQGSDTATAELLAKTTKKCPFCATPTTHFFDHGCHHIKPTTGCVGKRADGELCGRHWCYLCGKVMAGYDEDLEEDAPADEVCCCEDPFCPKDRSCDCPVCPECTDDKKCSHFG